MIPPGVFPVAGTATLEAAEAKVVAVAGSVRLVAVGWAPVDLDRASASARGRGGEGVAPVIRDLADDVLLGARCRLVTASPEQIGGMPLDGEDLQLVLLEPSTEGRLAASLARFGEGPAALYLGVAPGMLERLRAAGPATLPVSRPAAGPLGASLLVLGGPVYGPHLVVTEVHSLPSAP